MIKMAVMGYGVVGGGVYEVVRENSDVIAKNLGDELDIKYILDIRDFPEHPEKELFVKDAEIIANDPEVSIVAETMGGVTFAYDYTKRMLEAGKNVVTSNKELVSKKGAELFEIAKKNNVAYMFEASVGGGIPLIRPFVNCLAANKVLSVYGIMNGTTNYILTKMFKEGESFEDALADAQRLGYAEKNPAADVEGHDTLRKISILTALAFGSEIDDKKIPVEGITNITEEDVRCAAEAGCAIKLIGYSQIHEDKVFARVCPMLVPYESPLAHVEDVFNAIMVTGNMVGDTMMYGRGAGKRATASAIVADVMDIARNGGFDRHFSWEREKENSFISPDETVSSFFVRCDKSDDEIESVFGNVKFIEDGAFITENIREDEFAVKTERLGGVLAKIRVYN
jgi:homoserine dehydrogenase